MVQFDFEGRVSRARQMMQEHGIDCLYVTAGPNMTYFTGWSAYAGGWPVWLSAFLLPLTGEAVLIISKMHYDIFKHTGSWVKDVRTHMDGEDPTGHLGEVLKEMGLARGRIAVDDRMWFGDYRLLQEVAPDAQVVSGSFIIDGLRMIKDAAEIEMLRKANEISGVGFQRAAEVIRAGVSEYQAAMEISQAMLNAGSERMGVGGHFRSLSPRIIEPGDIIDIDIGGTWKGYGTDTARNVFVAPVSKEAERMWQVTAEAFDATFEIIKPGVPLEEVDRTCVQYMARHGYQQVWKVGHGVGLGGVHEAPLVQAGETMLTKAGMVFVVDPGCFVPDQWRDIPIHIENAIVVTENGAENLTTYTHELIVV